MSAEVMTSEFIMGPVCYEREQGGVRYITKGSYVGPITGGNGGAEITAAVGGFSLLVKSFSQGFPRRIGSGPLQLRG